MKWTEDDEKSAGSVETDSVYPFEIVSAEEKISKKDNPYINLTLNVFVGENTQTMYDIIMPQMPAKLKSFCETLGLMSQLQSRTLSVTDCGAGEGFIRTSKKKNKDGYAQIESYLVSDPTAGHPKTERNRPQPAAAGPHDDSDIPF